MRPPEFTGGNACRTLRGAVSTRPRFNEAAGIHRRKHAAPNTTYLRTTDRFNEAAGIHRRKLQGHAAPDHRIDASMRPPEFTGGNQRVADAMEQAEQAASMRPPEFTGGNVTDLWDGIQDIWELQ